MRRPTRAALRRAACADDPAMAVPGLMSIRGFEMALGHCLELLDGVHAGVTLFAVGWPAVPPPAAERALVSALSPLGSVGRLPDGRIGLAYLGPRGSDRIGAEALKAYVHNRLVLRLSEHGWAGCAAAMELVAVHGWTDRVAAPAELFAALPKAGSKRLDDLSATA